MWASVCVWALYFLNKTQSDKEQYNAMFYYRQLDFDPRLESAVFGNIERQEEFL
ncbi:hypothetical protein YC2023_086710 [Brassica napus]